MGGLFVISDEFEKKLHPEARKLIHEWITDVQRQVLLDEVNNDDLKYLSAADIIKLKRIYEVSECLNKCVDIKDGDKLYDVYFGDIVFSKGVISQLRRDLLNIEFDIVLPLIKIYGGRVAKAKEEERKRVEEEKCRAAKAEEEQRRREEEERQQAEKAREEGRKREEDRQWEEASRHVFPLTLLKEARRYLNKDDTDKLYDAAVVATRVYLQQGDSYLDNYKTFNYRWWLGEIDCRKEKEQIHLDAQAQAQAFCPRLDQGLKEIERKLSPEKEDPAVRIKRYCSNKGEARYLGESFADIIGDDDRKNNWTQGYIPAAEQELLKFIPEELRDFILTKPTVAFFLLPSANYSHCGVPCLDFYFDVFAVVTITVLVQAGQKVFNRYKFNFLTNLREPKLLGFYQITITPNEPDFWQSIPISIIRAFIDRNLQPPGITIVERTDELTVYEVKKFKEDICVIPISFERYCRSSGSFEKMRELGIIKERTAEILESPKPININHKESKSKKAQAFALFSQGRRPGDPEVKALGIKPESAYRYYQDWKKEATVGNNRI